MIAMPMSLFAQKQILQLDTARNFRSESYLLGNYDMPDYLRSKYDIPAYPTLMYDVTYDIPDHFDEEYTHRFVIEMIDTLALKKGKVLNVAKDSAIVKCHYTLLTSNMLLMQLYQPERFPATMIGTIKVLNWTDEAIEFEFDIAIKEGTRKGFLFYQGNKKLSRTVPEMPEWIKAESKKNSR